MKTRWPEPRSTIAGKRACAISIGDSRLTRSARFTCSALKSPSQPAAGQAGVGDEDVDVSGLLGELLRGAGLGEVGGEHAVAVAGQPAAISSSASRLRALSRRRRAARRQRLGDRAPEAPGGAGEQGCAAGKFHPTAQATSRPADRIEVAG